MNNSRRPGRSALRKGRYSRRNGVYFITVVTDRRVKHFEDFTIACAMSRQLYLLDSRLSGKMLCWVVMPDHIHFLLQLGESELNRVVQGLKAGSGAKLNRLIGRKGPFWETGFYDHGLRHEEDARGIARYIIANPVRARLVDSVRHYPFWSATWL